MTETRTALAAAEAARQAADTQKAAAEQHAQTLLGERDAARAALADAQTALGVLTARVAQLEAAAPPPAQPPPAAP